MSKEGAAPAHHHAHPAPHHQGPETEPPVTGESSLGDSSLTEDEKYKPPGKPAHTASGKRKPGPAAPAGRYLHPPDAETEYLISFDTPDDPTPEERSLTADIVILDHRNRHQLRPRTPEWEEVSKLLVNAVVFLQGRDAEQGRVILKEAEDVYFHHNQTRNRIRYLSGALAGVVAAGALGAALLLVSKPMEQIVTRQMLVLILVFAGIGSVTSVLTRISSIDLKEETSKFSVFVSGLSRPVVAMVLAVVVYLIVNGKILDIKVGSSSDPLATFLVISFLCGFSERFAQDIVARVPFGSSGGESEPK